MKNAVIYARFSSDKQREESIEGQLRVCRGYAQREGYNIIEEYCDRAISGTTDKRPEFQRMIKDAENGEFQAIICYKLDRFARNRYYSAVYKRELRQNGVRVISATEGIGDVPESIILEGMLEAFAEFYVQQLSQNVTRGMEENINKGLFNGGGIAFGYKVENQRLVINEEEAKIVRFIFESYANGMKKKQIADALNEKGYRNRDNKPFVINSFNAMFHNKRYVGIITWKDIEYKDESIRIVSDDIFNRVQKELAMNYRGGNREKVDYLLKGKVFCGHCGERMQGDSSTSKSGEIYRYYSCVGKKKKHTCDKKRESKQYLEDLVVRTTLYYFRDNANMEDITEQILRVLNKPKDDSISKKIKELEKEQDKIFDLLTDMPSNLRQKYYGKMEDIEAQIVLLKEEEKRQNLRFKTFTKEEVQVFLNFLTDGEIDDAAFRKRLIKIFVNSVYVYDDKFIVYYNLTDGEDIVTFDTNKECAKDKSGSPPSCLMVAHGIFAIISMK